MDQLKKENVRLKKLLQANGIEYEVESFSSDEEKIFSEMTFPDAHLGKDERVELFRSLFRGRQDVFARRWYSKATNKGGYQPVCINEWRRGICDKKAVKCADCPNRNFLALGYDEICRHLIGNDENGCDVIGIYAIMPDNNCTIIIDKSVVWYGGVNALGYNSEKDNIIKLKDEKLASEMQNVCFV